MRGVECHERWPRTGIPTAPSQGDVIQARWGTHGDHPIIVMATFSMIDYFEITVTAFNFSEKYRVPVLILSDEVVAHTRERITLPLTSCLKVINSMKPKMPPERYIPYENSLRGVPPVGIFGDGYRYHVSRNSYRCLWFSGSIGRGGSKRRA